MIDKGGYIQDLFQKSVGTAVEAYGWVKTRRDSKGVHFVQLNDGSCFNDLHHVVPDSSGNLLVTSTGLEMVVRVTPDGEILDQWNVLGEDPWEKFSRDTDYRKVDSTKPHRSHPNFAFELDGNIWATRFYQRDAVCLSDPSKRIDIGVQAPHDGLVRNGSIHFTTVDGHIVIVSRHSLLVEKIIDLKTINGLCNYFKVRPGDLFDYSPDPES